MSGLSKQALRVENNQSFPNNNAGLITPSNLRTFNENMIDSTVNQTDYTTDSASFDSRINNITGSATDTGSLLTTASFDNGTRDLTFTKGDSSQFSVNIPDASGSVLPSGVVSGSSQIDYPQISNIPSGIVSSSEQLPSGLVSGSSQIDYTGISNIPSGIVSSSSQIILQDTTGLLSGSRIDGEVALALNSTYAQNTIITGKNLHNTTIGKGTPLYFTGSGTSGNLVGVYPADAGDPTRMPAGGVAGESLAVGAEGIVLLNGFINGVDTSLFASGDEIFVAVGGGYINVAPTGSALIQHLGYVEKSAVNGSGVIQMMGEVRGLPNIQQGYAWVGDSNGVPLAVSTGSFAGTTIDTGSFATTGSNSFTGTQIVLNTDATQRGIEVQVAAGNQQYLRLGPVDGNSGNMAFMITGSDASPAEGQKVWGINTAGGIWRNTFFSDVTFADDIIARNNVSLIWQGGTTEAGSRLGVNHISESVQVYTGLSSDGHYIVSSSVEERIIDVNPTTATVTIANTITSQIFLNPQTLTGTQTVPTGFNGMLTGDVSNAGTIVVEGGANLIII